MRTHAQIIADAGGYQGFASRIAPGDDVLAKRARFWARRNSIPHDHWPATVETGLATWDELFGRPVPVVSEGAAA